MSSKVKTISSHITNQIFLQLFLSLLFLIALNHPTFGQEDKLIPPKKLLKDFGQVQKILTAHPDPLTHVSLSVFTDKMNSIKSSLNEPHTQLDFYKKIASLVALIKDGHSSVGLPEFWMQKKRKEFGCFPYEMHLTNKNELFVLKNFAEGEMPPGARVFSINGISVDSFLNSIDPFISYEKLSFRNTLIDDNFEKYLYLAFNTSKDLSFKYFMKDTLETVVQNMPMGQWKKFQRNDQEEGELLISQGQPYSYEKVTDGIGMLKIYGFFARDIDRYNHFLLKTFKSIQKDSIHSLIIDIRGNYGGWPKISSELFHYIHDGYFKTMAQSSMKVSYPYRNYFYDRYPFLRTTRAGIPKRRHYVDLLSILDADIDSYINEAAFFNEEPITESFEFQGDVYLMTNRDSYSAASSFASTFQCYSMGLIIGEETGGTKIFRANTIAAKLSNSGIIVRMSTTKLFSTCYSDELKGVTPNIEYNPSIFELLSDIDTQLIFVMRVIKKVREKQAAQLKAAPESNK